METIGTATPDTIIKIKSKMRQMTPAMQKLAKYIVDNFEKLDGIQIQQLAKQSEVSEATITRFSKELGFSNYQAFVLQIAKENTSHVGSEFSYSSVKEDDDVDTICSKIFSINLQTITDTLHILDKKEIEKAAAAIAEARRIMIFAQGRSVVTAGSLQQRLRRLGIFPCLYEETHEGTIASSFAGEGDTVIGISTHGRSGMVVKSLKRARENGAVTIAVTSYEDTPIEASADIILRAINNENLNFGYEPSCATVTQMIMLDCLYMVLYMQNKDEVEIGMERSVKAVEEERI